MRVSPLLLMLLLATSVSGGFASTLHAQEHVPGSISCRRASKGSQGPMVVPVTSIEPTVKRQRSADTATPFQITAATTAMQDQLSNEQDTVASTLKPLSEIRFRPQCDDCLTKDFFADLNVNSELPAVSPHFKGWVPAGLVHSPLYFEEHSLERCGQTAPGIRQPFVSGTRFFARGILFPLQTRWNRPHALESTDSDECNFFDK